MKVANAFSAEDVRVRLCFLVNVRNASGRKVAGGRRIGRTVDFTGGLRPGGARMGAVLRGLTGWAGVPNAGDEDGIGFVGTAEGFSGLRAVAITARLYGSFDVVDRHHFTMRSHFTAR